MHDDERPLGLQQARPQLEIAGHDSIRNLVDCSSKGGNYLLNVGPTSEGLIPQPSVERLAEIGRWMKVNGEAIYGTAASPIEDPANGAAARKSRASFTCTSSTGPTAS